MVYLLTAAGRKSVADKYRDSLLNDVVPFWLRHGVDDEYGGIITGLDRDGTVIDTDKGMWQQGRWLWLLAELCNTVEARDEWLRTALRTADFIERFGFDQSDGRMWFQVTREGRPLRKRRYAFSESFAAIGFGELAQATGDRRYAELAQRCFHAFVSHVPPPKFTDERPARSLGMPMITIATAQDLRDSISLECANAWIDRSVEIICRDHRKPDIRCVMETVGLDGKIIDHFDGRTLNPGHAIEAAWFLMLDGRYRNDTVLQKTGCEMLDWMWERGWDREHGGLLYFVDVDGHPVQEYWHDMKFWWPQCELMLAALLAFELTGDAKYAGWHAKAHDWFFEHFADREHGEFFGYLHRDGTLSSTLKGNLWKGPFHIPRMLLWSWQWLTSDGHPQSSCTVPSRNP
ncbi:MAG: AGE family epimerase/isomerase [Planctomycetaceae bacterium]